MTPEQERLDHLDDLEREMKSNVDKPPMPWPEFTRMVEDAWEVSVNGPAKRRKKVLLIGALAIIGVAIAVGVALLLLKLFP